MFRWVAGCVCVASLLSCSSGPCSRGQELREEKYPATQTLKERGCMEKNDEGNYWRQGKWEVFYADGQKGSERTYKDGKEEGLSTVWHQNGQKKWEGTYRAGKKEGLVTLWYENGQKWVEGAYKDGKEEGLHTRWRENGQKSDESVYKAGSLVLK